MFIQTTVAPVGRSKWKASTSPDTKQKQDKTADRIIVDIRNMLRDFKIQVFDERNGSGWLRHVLVKRGFSTNEVMVVLVAVLISRKNKQLKAEEAMAKLRKAEKEAVKV